MDNRISDGSFETRAHCSCACDPVKSMSTLLEDVRAEDGLNKARYSLRLMPGLKPTRLRVSLRDIVRFLRESVTPTDSGLVKQELKEAQSGQSGEHHGI